MNDSRTIALAPARPRHGARALLLLALAVLALAAWGAWSWIERGVPLPVEVAIDGAPLLDPLAFTSLSGTDKFALALGLAVAALLVPLALSIAVLAVVAALLLVIALAIALPLLFGGAVLALVFSPLLLIGWLAWRTASRPAAAAAPDRRSDTIAA